MPDLPDVSDEAVAVGARALQQLDVEREYRATPDYTPDARRVLEAAASLVGAAYLRWAAGRRWGVHADLLTGERRYDIEPVFDDITRKRLRDIAAGLEHDARRAARADAADGNPEPGADAPSKSVARRLARTDPNPDPNP